MSPSLEKQYLGVEEILQERGDRYGKFSSHARLTQELKSTFLTYASNSDTTLLTPYMQEALDMIFHKIGRIGNGDPFYDDSWIDIAGYSQLVVDELHGEGK
jgi:hypothetical protein